MKAKEMSIELVKHPKNKIIFMTASVKFIGLCLALSITNIQLSWAQTAKDIFNTATPITYLGIDFTQARVIGEKAAATEIRDQHFPGINGIVSNQSNQYDIAEALHRTEISSDLSQVTVRNKTIPVQQIKSESPFDVAHLKSNDIQKLVSTYNFANKTGIGLLFVVDGLSAWQQYANVYVTFIDMSSKKVLLTERVEGKAGGFGFRNYYAKSILDVLHKIRKSKYNEWQKRHAA